MRRVITQFDSPLLRCMKGRPAAGPDEHPPHDPLLAEGEAIRNGWLDARRRPDAAVGQVMHTVGRRSWDGVADLRKAESRAWQRVSPRSDG